MSAAWNLLCRRGAWLMIVQRLQPNGTLASTVQQGLISSRISTRTGGCCQARRKMPKLAVKRVGDEIAEQLRKHSPSRAGVRCAAPER